MTSSTCIGSGSVGSGFGVSSGCFVIVLVIVVVLVLEEGTGSVNAPIVQINPVRSTYLHIAVERPFSSTRTTTRTSTIFGFLRASKPADIGLSCPCLNLLLLLIGPVVPISSIKKLNQQELT